MPPTRGRPAEDVWSVDEIRNWCANPPVAEAQRIDIAARTYARATMAEAHDLKQEALMQVLIPRRWIKRKYPIWQGIIGIIRGISYKEKLHSKRFIPASDTIDENAEFLFGKRDVSPEERAQWRKDWPAFVKLIEDEFADRPLLMAELKKRTMKAVGKVVITPQEDAVPTPQNDKEKRAVKRMLSRRLRKLRRQIDE